MSNEPEILIGKGKTPQILLLKYANRHGFQGMLEAVAKGAARSIGSTIEREII